MKYSITATKIHNSKIRVLRKTFSAAKLMSSFYEYATKWFSCWIQQAWTCRFTSVLWLYKQAALLYHVATKFVECGVALNYDCVDITRCRRCQQCFKQGVALTRRNRTGPPCSVGSQPPTCLARRLPTGHAPGGRPARPLAASQSTDDDRRQTPASKNHIVLLGGPVIIQTKQMNRQDRDDVIQCRRNCRKSHHRKPVKILHGVG